VGAGLTVVTVPSLLVMGGTSRLVEPDALESVLGVVWLVLVNFACNKGPIVVWQMVYVCVFDY
jgi:hypothetical protein